MSIAIHFAPWFRPFAIGVVVGAVAAVIGTVLILASGFGKVGFLA